MAMNRAPKIRVCEVADASDGSMNCGRKAKKKIDSFGLRILMKMPCQKIDLPDLALASRGFMISALPSRVLMAR